MPMAWCQALATVWGAGQHFEMGRNPGWAVRVWLVLGMLLVVPAVSAQDQGASVPTDLFVHVINVMDAPINTQEPAASWSDDAMFGPLTTTLRCLHGMTGDPLDLGVGTGGTTGQAFHTFRGYGTPSLVEYSVPTASGTPRTHPNRGVWANVTIDTTTPMALHWFLKTTQDGNTPAPVIPNVLVRAAIRAEDRISVDDRAYDEGRLLFSGQAGPVTLVNGEVFPADGASGTVQAVTQQGDAWVYEFVLPLEGLDPILRMHEGYNLRVDMLMDAPGCDEPDATVMPSGVAVHTSPGLRPRIAWSVVDPMATGHAALGINLETSKPWISIQAATVFGAEDTTNVVVDLVRVARDGSRVPVPLETTLVSGYGACGHDCGHTMEVRYAPEGGFEPGRYNLTVSWDNLQGTAHRVATAEVVIQPPAEAPSIGLAALLAILAVAVIVRRRA